MILVLIQTLDSMLIYNSSSMESVEKEENDNNANHDIPSLMKYEPMAQEVQYGKNILLHGKNLQQLERQAEGFIPLSHMPLFSYALQTLAPTLQPCLLLDEYRGQSKGKTNPNPPLTGILTTILCPLFEHSLRILWCKANNRPHDCIARPSAYYGEL